MATGCWGGSVVPPRFSGCVCSFPPSPFFSPSFVGSRFLFGGHALVPCDTLRRLRGAVVAPSAPCFSGVLARGTLSYTNWGKSVDGWERPTELALRKGPLDLPPRFYFWGEPRSWVSFALEGLSISGNLLPPLLLQVAMRNGRRPAPMPTCRRFQGSPHFH